MKTKQEWTVQNARRLDGIDYPPDPMNNTTCPLILVKPSGRIVCAVSKSERREIVEIFQPEHDVLLMAWPGQWNTDVFRLDEADLKRGR
jgi:hypothetical protein